MNRNWKNLVDTTTISNEKQFYDPRGDPVALRLESLLYHADDGVVIGNSFANATISHQVGSVQVQILAEDVFLLPVAYSLSLLIF